MQTLKTAIVVVLLLVVFYGVYEMLNRSPVEDPPAVAALSPDATAELDIDMGDISSFDSPDPSTDSSSFAPPVDTGDPVSTAGDVTMSIPEPQVPSYYGGSAQTPDEEADASHYQPPSPAPSTPVQQPESAVQPPVARRTPIAEDSVVAVPGGPAVQHNPFVNEDAVPKPVVPNSGTRQLGALEFQRAMKTAESLVAEGQYREALARLSVFYKSGDLTGDEQRQLVDLLDPLAGRVIYSREHLLERPYVVGRNETLMDIARKYNVPYFLLQKINGIENPEILLPNSELKVVRGPFRAQVDLAAQELTLFLGQLYAGRFPITVGSDLKLGTGEFQVRDKRPGTTYFSLDGRTIPAENPANPFGRVWIDLGREVSIHGSPAEGINQHRGCISLSPHDADDVYSILSVGSKIRILR